MGFLACKGGGFPRTIGLLELKAECQVAKPTSGRETPADGAPYIFFVTGEALNPLLVEAFLVLKRDEAKRLKNGHIDQIRDYYLPFL